MTIAFAYVISNEKHTACFSSKLLSISVHSTGQNKICKNKRMLYLEKRISCWIFMTNDKADLNVKFACQLCHLFDKLRG